MPIYPKLLVFLLAASALSAAGCSRDMVSPSRFTHTKPTIFTNSEDATIKVSTEGMLVGGEFYKANNCSDEKFNCYAYGGKILFITPKYCYMPPMQSWRVEGFVAQLNGYDQDTSGDVVQTSFGNGVGYGFSEIKGRGIDSIAYDVKGIYQVPSGDKFYADIPSDRMDDMLYFSPVGPAFLPCVEAWKGR